MLLSCSKIHTYLVEFKSLLVLIFKIVSISKLIIYKQLYVHTVGTSCKDALMTSMSSRYVV